MTAANSGRQARFSGVAQVTILQPPGDPIVVTHAAKPPFRQVRHGDVIGSDAHLEAEFVMTDLAAEPDAMEPVVIDDWPNAGRTRITVQHDVSVLGPGRDRINAHQDHQTEDGEDHAVVHGKHSGLHDADRAPRGTLWQRAHSVPSSPRWTS